MMKPSKDLQELAFVVSSHMFDVTAPYEVIKEHAQKMIDNGELTEWDAHEDDSDSWEDDTCLFNQQWN